jgi:hypothetical protein
MVLSSLVIMLLMIAIRMIASMAFWGLLSKKELVYFSLSHSMPLTLLIAVATLAFQNSSMDEFYYYAFILASLFEVIVVMVGIKLLHKMDIA